ncbi:hypothetical protein KPATCC21470_0812 [Kitasatospora purpeofusca]
MSNGSARLSLRAPETFAITGMLDVTEQGKPVTGLNELECGAGTSRVQAAPASELPSAA